MKTVPWVVKPGSRVESFVSQQSSRDRLLRHAAFCVFASIHSQAPSAALAQRRQHQVANAVLGGRIDDRPQEGKAAAFAIDGVLPRETSRSTRPGSTLPH